MLQRYQNIRKLIKSLVFTDVIIRNCNANAVVRCILHTAADLSHSCACSDVPVFCRVGGTTWYRVVNLAEHAEFQGAVGVV